MPTKKEVMTAKGQADASIIVNNSFIDALSAQLEEKKKYGLTFPQDYNPTNELMGAYLILKETTDKNKVPVLQSCSQESIANTLLDMVTSGVSMQKKQCYPVAYGGKLTCQMSVFGNTCIARRYGLKTISAMVIYKNDDFEYEIVDGERVITKHTQDFNSINPDEIVGAYAVATMENGTKHTEIMNLAQIKKAWKKSYNYREGSGVHEDFKEEMCMKTVKNRCLKHIVRTYGEPVVSDFIETEEINSDDIAKINADVEIKENANTIDFSDVINKPVPPVEEETPETIIDVESEDVPF